MLAHKLRLALTTASIALGVAFLAGTFVLTDTMGLAFSQLFGKVSAGTDAVVRTEAPYSATEGVGTSRGPIAASVLPQVAKGRRRAHGRGLGHGLRAADRQRRPRHPHQGGRADAGLQHGRRRAAPRRRRPAVRHGPTTGHEVAIDATSAEEHDIALGSTIKVLFQGPTQEFTVVGTVGFGGEKNLGGTTSAYFDTETAQRVLGSPFDSIGVSADPA